MKNVIASIIFVVLAACGHGTSLDGTYVTEQGRSLTFKPDGTAYETNGGKVIDKFNYSVDGEKIVTEGRLWQLTLLKNGAIGSQVYGEMKKK